ncbi:MAG: sensor histidine kinase [Chlorobi bacterium]|nr:sensor histidine kinase [Chlorobiota bacterium]
MKKKLASAIFIIVLFSLNLYSQYKTDSLINEISIVSTQSEKVNILIELCSEYLKTDYDEAVKYGKEALEISQEIKYRNGLKQSLFIYGKALTLKGEYEEAIKIFTEALVFKNDSAYHASILYQIGRSYFFLQEYEKSTKRLLKALKLQEDLNDTMQAKSFNIIGLNNMYLNQFEIAAKYYAKALRLEKLGNDKAGLSNTLTNFGILYRRMEKFDSSRFFYHEALEVAKKKNDLKRMANALNNIGLTYVYQKKAIKGTDYIKEALAIKEKLGDKNGIFRSYFNLGTIYIDLKKYDLAKYYLKKCLKIQPDSRINWEVYTLLADIDSATGDYLAAFNNFKEFHRLQTNRYNALKAKQFNELQIQYETEKKEEAIILLQKENDLATIKILKSKNQKIFLSLILILVILVIIIIWYLYSLRKKSNEILKQKNDDLTKLNNYKNKFFSIIAHDLKNPLSAFQNVTGVLLESYDSYDEKTIKKYLEKLYISSGNVGEMLNNLLHWSLNQMEGIKFESEPIQLKNAIEKAVSIFSLNLESKEITVQQNIKSTIYVNSDSIILSTVIRNLVSNAIKFSNKNGVIYIKAEEDKNEVVISVEDTGIGISQEDINKLFDISYDTKAIGNSPEKGTGLGLILTKELLEKNNGKIWAMSNLGKGSKFYFTMPKANLKKEIAA